MRQALGKWIENKTTRPFYARRVFTVGGAVRSATVRVCGLGQFVLHINGHKVGDHELDPGWTNYRKRIQYVTFDVTDDLVAGANVIGAEVGNGWFIMENEHYSFHFPPFMPPNPNPYQPFGQSLVLALLLEIEYVDGSSETITADDTFRTHAHEVTMSNVYGSENIDGSAHPAGWDTADYDDSCWEPASIVPDDRVPQGVLEEQFQPPIKVLRRYHAEYLHTVTTENGTSRRIYDLGQNMSGMLGFEIRGHRGQEIWFYPAEKLDQNGNADQMAKNWMMIDNVITYRIGSDDTWESYRMRFTYYAGRYIAVEGMDDDTQLRDLYGDAISSVWETDGSFTCDDARYNQIYSLVEKAVEANMVSVHTDCPTIERFAWQEPNHLMAPSIMYMKRSDRLWDKFLLDMRTDQLTAEDYFLDYEGGRYYPGAGLIPSQCPCYIPNVLPVPGMGSFYDIIPWGSTCILGTYWHYMFYGNEQIIRDNYEAGARYLTHELSMRNADGFLNHGLGDWGNPDNLLLRENVETAFLYADTATMQRFAEILGKSSDVATYAATAEEIRENYNMRLLTQHPEKGYYCYRAYDHPNEFLMTQAAEALPLYWGLVPEQYEADVVRAFRDTLEEKGALASGEIGLPYIIQMARRYDMNDLIAAYITRTEHPSYYAFVLDGETTLGEYWESNPRSHCHDMMGHIIEWFYNGIAGIQPLEPGFKSVRIRPYMPEGMHEFTCSYRSVRGTITVHAVRGDDGVVRVRTKVPEGVTIVETEPESV